MAKRVKKWHQDKDFFKRNLIRKNGGAVCALCHQPFAKMSEITLDHIVPVSKGGLDVIENMQLAHGSCNQIKASMSQEEFELRYG